MSTDYLPRITPRDLNILEAMRDDCLDDDVLMNALRSKLQLAQIVFADDLPPDVVTLGSRLAFQIGSNPIEERTLVAADHYVPGKGYQSVGSLCGMAMLGLAEGNCVELTLDGRSETLSIIEVLYQPEADRRARKKQPGLRLVSSRQETVPESRWLKPDDPFDDDPGPSAA